MAKNDDGSMLRILTPSLRWAIDPERYATAFAAAKARNPSLSQESVARQLNIENRSWLRYRTLKKPLDIWLMRRIADILGCPSRDFVLADSRDIEFRVLDDNERRAIAAAWQVPLRRPQRWFDLSSWMAKAGCRIRERPSNEVLNACQADILHQSYELLNEKPADDQEVMMLAQKLSRMSDLLDQRNLTFVAGRYVRRIEVDDSRDKQFALYLAIRMGDDLSFTLDRRGEQLDPSSSELELVFYDDEELLAWEGKSLMFGA